MTMPASSNSPNKSNANSQPPQAPQASTPLAKPAAGNDQQTEAAARQAQSLKNANQRPARNLPNAANSAPSDPWSHINKNTHEPCLEHLIASAKVEDGFFTSVLAGLALTAASPALAVGGLGYGAYKLAEFVYSAVSNLKSENKNSSEPENSEKSAKASAKEKAAEPNAAADTTATRTAADFPVITGDTQQTDSFTATGDSVTGGANNSDSDDDDQFSHASEFQADNVPLPDNALLDNALLDNALPDNFSTAAANADFNSDNDPIASIDMQPN